MEIEIKETDSLFTDSPDAGHIDEDSNTEYRFCWSCSAEMGIKFNTD